MQKLPAFSFKRRLKNSIFKHLPGWRGLKYRRLDIVGRWKETDAKFERALQECRGKIAIDLGANVGEFSRRLASSASKVYAFEPDPWTAEKLRSNLADLENVEVVEAAASDKEGKLSIYRHPNYKNDPEAWSQSTTLMSDSRIADPDSPVAEVRVLNFAEFIRSLEKDVGVVKVDIEGAEVELLRALFDSDVLNRIDYIFCETHETDFPHLVADYRLLRRRARKMSKPVVNLDWY